MTEAHCRAILEVSEEAGPEEIAQAYQRLLRLYQDARTSFTAPAMEEFSEEACAEVLAEIEAAYQELSGLMASSSSPVQAPQPPEGETPSDGPSLRWVREAEGLSLERIAAQTHVRIDYLKAFEEERFGDLPHAAVNVRGFLAAYVAEMKLPVEEVVQAYMARFRAWQERKDCR